MEKGWRLHTGNTEFCQFVQMLKSSRHKVNSAAAAGAVLVFCKKASSLIVFGLKMPV